MVREFIDRVFNGAAEPLLVSVKSTGSAVMVTLMALEVDVL